MTIRSLLLGTLLASVGCRLGPGVKAMGAAGTPVEVYLNAEAQRLEYTGELLALDSTGVLILLPGINRVSEVRYPDLLRLEFTHTGVTLTRGGVPSPIQMNQIRQYARFPQGLSPDLRRRLLEAYRQQEPDTLGR